METRDWMILKILHQENSITKTAELLYLSQPAMTKRLQQIEKEFGVEIVHRGKRGIHFTPQGEYLAKCASDILIMLNKINDGLVNLNDSIEGTLRIGASYFITRHKLPELLSRFKRTYPKVNFKVTAGWSKDIFNLAHNQDVHIAIIRGDYNWKDQKSLLMEERVCVVSSEPLDLQDLPQLQRVDYKLDYKLKELIDHWWWENYSEPPHVCMEVDKSDTCKEMVVRGLGYAIMPEFVLSQTEGLHTIAIKDQNGTTIKRNTWLLYHKEFLDLKLVKTFVEFTKELNFAELR
ncbi:MAG: LysR family transcriptional regulator [Sporomusaceae bacterium]|nr:LysR family transcriptional regulator [Sporomusaceae bacterium]